MVPPMRPRAGTTLMLSTVANTAFSSATGRAATESVSATAGAATHAASSVKMANRRCHRIELAPAWPRPSTAVTNRVINPESRVIDMPQARGRAL